MKRRTGHIARGRLGALLPALCLGMALPVLAAGDGGGDVSTDFQLQRDAALGSDVPPAARPDDSRPLLREESALRKRAEEILKGPDFKPEETRYELRKKRPDAPKTQPEATPGWFASLAKFFRYLGDVSRVVVWVVVGVLILVLLFSLHWWWRATAPGRVRARRLLPTEVGGLDIRPESLPDDVGAAARAAWDRGDRIQALSLLYRGSLSALVVRYAAGIRGSSTEQECVRAARKVIPPDAATYFANLTQARLLAVYAQRWPASEAVHALCSEYSQHFAAMDKANPPAPGAVERAPA